MIPDATHALLAGLALACVLGAIWLVQRLVRASGFSPAHRAAGRRLAVQEAIALDARRRLHLVRCDGRMVLLMTGGSEDLVVGWLAAPPGAGP